MQPQVGGGVAWREEAALSLCRDATRPVPPRFGRVLEQWWSPRGHPTDRLPGAVARRGNRVGCTAEEGAEVGGGAERAAGKVGDGWNTGTGPSAAWHAARGGAAFGTPS